MGPGEFEYIVSAGNISAALARAANMLVVYPGDNLQVAYDWLKSASRDAAMGAVSTTNRRFLIRMPGTYTGNLEIDTKYVELSDVETVTDTGVVTYSGLYGPTIGTGDGSSRANALNIDSPEALRTLSDTPADWTKYCLLTEDIDLGGSEFRSIGRFGVAGGTFAGTLDGAGHTISNLKVTVPDLANGTALIARATGTIRDLDVINPVVIGSNDSVNALSQYTAVIVAEFAAAGEMYRCNVFNPNVQAIQDQAGEPAYCGILTGSCHGLIESCNVVGGVVKADNLAGTTLSLGGLVGYQIEAGGLINNCSSTAEVRDVENSSVGLTHVGGLLGGNLEVASTLSNSWHKGTISYHGKAQINIGGIAGDVKCIVTNCKHDGIVESINTSASGFGYVGGAFGGIESGATISRCCSNAEIRISESGSYNTWTGGFCGAGVTTCTIDDCYCKGTFFDIDADSSAMTVTFLGGFMGRTANATATNCIAVMGPWSGGDGFLGVTTGSPTFTDCFWDTDVAGFATADPEATGKTTAQLMAIATYGGTGFDFTLPSRDWKLIEGYSYPVLDFE